MGGWAGQICCILSHVFGRLKYLLQLTGASEAGARVLGSHVKGLAGATSPAQGFKEGAGVIHVQAGKQVRGQRKEGWVKSSLRSGIRVRQVRHSLRM